MAERERRLTTIVAIDVAAYSRLMHADEAGTLDRMRAARAITDPIAEAHGARIVGSWGDGLLVEFPSVVHAVEFAREAQAAMVGFNADTPEDRQLLYRIGVNLGDVIVEEGDLFGDGVNVAARLETLAPPGGIVLSRAARDQVRDKLDVAYEDLGEVEVKNIARPVRAFRVLREGEAEAPPKRPERRWAGITTAAIAVLALLAGGIWWYTQQPEFTPADPAKMEFALNEPSIAVLAFDNLTGDPEQEHVSDGISEDIISILARVPRIVVIARNSSFSYKGKPVDIRQIAEEMSVRYVLEGSLQSFDENLRVTAQLIDAITGRHIWAKSFDRPREEFFKVRDEIIYDIVSELNIELIEGESLWNKYSDFGSIDTWLLGRKIDFHVMAFTRTDNQIAIDLLHKLLEKEPNSAGARGQLAMRHSWNARVWGDDPDKSWQLAEASAEEAISLQPNSPEGYRALAFVRYGQGRVEEAIALAERVLELAPGDADGTAFLGVYLQKDMQVERAIEVFRRAIRMNRRALGWIWENYGEAFVIAGRYEEAIAIYEEALKRNVNGAIRAEVHLGLAVSYDALGRADDAREQMAAAVEALPEVSVVFMRGYIPYEDQEYKERWLATLKRLGLPEE